MKLTFCGGAREVTGACHLLESGSTKILVDCGLFQGGHELEALNEKPFPFDPKSVDALCVTHAHLDHVGRIPQLVREGFAGTIYSTAATKDLARLMLEDALHLAEREKKAFYTIEDIERACTLWHGLSYHESVRVGDMSVMLRDAGHILGSSFVDIEAEGKRVLFTGDLGNTPSSLLPPPETVHGVEYLIIESAYGNRVHESGDDRALKLERAVEDAAARGGTLMIPAFATERTQDILFLLNEMLLFKRVPTMPVFVDAPLAIRITQVYERHLECYKEEIKALAAHHPNLFKFKTLRFTESSEESKSINSVPAPKTIIAGSGMMTGGRILHHLRRYLSDAKSILLIVGYQSSGSLGRRLADGEKQVKLFGEEITAQAEIRTIDGFSAHADNPQLFAFVEGMRDSLKKVFVVQGEEAQSLHFAGQIQDRLGVSAATPILEEHFDL